MISIVNMGPHDTGDPAGIRTYELRINREVIATFRHRRSDGLAACLRKASEAAQAADDIKTFRILEAMQEISTVKTKCKKKQTKQRS